MRDGPLVCQNSSCLPLEAVLLLLYGVIQTERAFRSEGTWQRGRLCHGDGKEAERWGRGGDGGRVILYCTFACKTELNLSAIAGQRMLYPHKLLVNQRTILYISRVKNDLRRNIWPVLKQEPKAEDPPGVPIGIGKVGGKPAIVMVTFFLVVVIMAPQGPPLTTRKC